MADLTADVHVTVDTPEILQTISLARQEGKVSGLKIALKYAKIAKRGRTGQLELIGYLESQLKLAEEVPF